MKSFYKFMWYGNFNIHSVKLYSKYSLSFNINPPKFGWDATIKHRVIIITNIKETFLSFSLYFIFIIIRIIVNKVLINKNALELIPTNPPEWFNTLILKYIATRNPLTGEKQYQLFEGYDEASLTEFQSRYYWRVLNLEYVNSNRDLRNYIKREQAKILQEVKDSRNEETKDEDCALENDIKNKLEEVSVDVNKLSYVNTATKSLNDELCALNLQKSEDITFSAGDIDTNRYINNLNL